MTQKTLMIFGANGYIGSHLIDYLSHDETIRLTLIIKPEDNPGTLINKNNVKVIHANVTNSDDLSQLVYNRVDTVIYLCGTKSRNMDEVSNIYHQAPLNIVKKLAEHCNAHFLMISNISVYGHQGDGVVTENVSPRPNNSLGRLIHKSEKDLIEQYPNTTILRLPAVFGGEKKVMVPSPVVVDNGSNFMNFVWIGDVITVIRRIVELPDFGIYHLSDNVPICQKEAATLLSIWWRREAKYMSSCKASRIFTENTFGILTNSVKLDSTTILKKYSVKPKTLKSFVHKED